MAEKNKKLRAEEKPGTLANTSDLLQGVMVSATVIAKIYGETVQTINNLKQSGIIKSVGAPARFDLIPTLQALYDYQRKRLKNKGNKAEETLAKEREKLDAEVRYKLAKAKLVESQLAEQEGQLHRSEDVKEIVSNNIMTIRGMILSLPGKLAMDCAEENNPMKIAAIVKREIFSILNDLSEYDYSSEAYREKVLKRYGLIGETEDGDSEQNE